MSQRKLINNKDIAVLKALSEVNGEIHNSEFKVRGISKDTMKKITTKLHNNGYIQKISNLLDMRRIKLAITIEGREIIGFE